MLDIKVNPTIHPIIKQNMNLKLKPVNRLQHIDIFAMPSRIKDDDIIAMFKGIMRLMKEKIEQQYTEKYLKLKLQYSRLKYLYDKKINSKPLR